MTPPGAQPGDIGYEELVARLGEEQLTVVDVRSELEYLGLTGAPCDPRQGHIPGAVNLDVRELSALAPDELQARLGAPGEVDVVAYCHSGSRSAFAVGVLRAAGYDARNYRGSWHEWSRRREE